LEEWYAHEFLAKNTYLDNALRENGATSLTIVSGSLYYLCQESKENPQSK